MSALHAFHFLHPAWLWLLAALPLLLWLALGGAGTRARLARLADPQLLPYLLHGEPRRRQLTGFALAAGWALACLALAGPTWSRQAQPLYAARPAQVVAISLSQRMLARDVAPDRMARARYKAHDLFAANAAGLNALVAYAGEAFTVAPLTSDAHSLSDLLDALSPDVMPVDGDDAAAAIRQGVALIGDAKAGGGSLVLVTDQADAEARAAAARARAAGVRVSVLGVGTAQGGPVPLGAGGFAQGTGGQPLMAARDDAALAALAEAGGGRYVPMTDGDADVRALAGELGVGRRTRATTDASAWNDRGAWLLLPLLALVPLTFRRGWLLLVVLGMATLVPRPARATDWSDLWLRRDQQAMRALEHGHGRQAEQLARDRALRGAAAYRAGDYDAAIAALEPLPGADAQYNLGNALARSGRYKEAIAAYDRALQRDPRHADARANRKAVQEWLRRHPPPPSGSDRQARPHDNSGQSQAPSKSGRNQDNDKGKGKGAQPNPSGQNGRQSGRSQPGQGAKPTQSGQSPRQPGDNRQGKPEPATAEQQARAEKARQALKRRLDRSLAGKRTQPPTEHQLGRADADDASSRLPPSLRQALQRVPDDPGALLRRKFELEYLRRHGKLPQEDGS